MKTTTKRGIKVVETREPVKPDYVIEWLLATLTNQEGIETEVERIPKKIRDSVLWNDTEIPFRRSGLWLTMKVVLHTFFVWKCGKQLGTIYYKTVMLKLMLELAKHSHMNTIDSDVKIQINAKIAHRMNKLKSLVDDCKEISNTSFIQSILIQGSQVVMTIEKGIKKDWNKIVEQNKENNSFELKQNVVNDLTNTRHTLSNAEKYLKIFGGVVDNSDKKKKLSVPKCIGRDFTNVIFNFNATEENDAFTQLFDFENWVRDEIDNWIYSKKLNYVEYSQRLYDLLTNYEGKAKKYYRNDPLGNSRMILTVLNIIRVLHILSIKISPILKEYKSGVEIEILQSVLAVTKNDLKYTKSLEDYFLNFDKNAHYTSILQQCINNDATSDSFFVRFAENNTEIQNTKDKILEIAKQKAAQKIEEIREKRKRYKKLKQKSNGLEHEYFSSSSYPYHNHSRNCTKCRYNNEADSITATHYEWPLPKDENECNSVMFELCAPNPLFNFRDALHLLATIDGRISDNGTNSSIKGLWRNTDQLSSYCTSKAQRITLASETKLFSVSHYKKVIELSEDEAVVPNGFGLIYASICGIEKRIRMESNANIKDLTYFRLQQDIYGTLDWSVKSLNHDQNQVLAHKFECHQKLAMTEFIEFGSFRTGHNLIIHNLVRCLETRSLSFEREDVLRLILQSLWESGPSTTTSWIRESNASLSDTFLVNELLLSLIRLLDEYQDNWKAISIVLLVISTCYRILTIYSENNENEYHFKSYFKMILSEMSNAPPKQVDEIRFRLIEIAACSCFTYLVDKEFIPKILNDSSSLTLWLKSIARIHDNLLLNKKGVNNLTHLQKFLLRRVYFTSLTIENHIYSGIEEFLNVPLNEFAKQHWHDFENGIVGDWERYDRWYCTEFKTKDTSIMLQIDSLRGALLINGSPIGRLPEQITNHPDYNRIFGNHVFEVQPGSSYNTFVTIHKFKGSIFRFSLLSEKEENISIVEIRDGKEYILFSHSHFIDQNQDLPSIFIENYSHWFESSTNTILFRSVSFVDTKESLYQLNLATREIKEMSTNRLLVDINSTSFNEIYSKILRRLELKHYIHMFTDVDNKITIDLPLKNLHFTLEGDNLKSVEYGMKVANDWNIETLIGINNGIRLVDENPMSTRELLLMPYGKIKVKAERSTGHQMVTIDMATNHSFFAYSINNRLKRLEGNESLISWLFLCLLHATTSSVIPDPFNNLTGTETAIILLQSARIRSSVPFNEKELDILHDIYNLSPQRNFYPEHLQNMQKIKWPDNIPSMAAHDAFCILVDNVINENQKFVFAYQQEKAEPFKNTNLKINIKEYWRSINYYSDTAKISLQFETKPSITKAAFSDWYNEKINNVRLITRDILNSNFNNVKTTLENFIWDFRNTEIFGISKKINKWNSVEEWRDIEPISDFLSLFEIARTAIPKGKKYCFIFLLSFLVYKYPSQCNILEIFKVVMLNFHYFEDINIPTFSKFTDLTENGFDESSVRRVLRQQCDDFSDLEDKTRLQYENIQNTDILLALSTLKSEWSSEKQYYTSYYSRFLNNQKAYSEIQTLMTKWKKNKELKIFINEVISCLPLFAKSSSSVLTHPVISNKEFSFPLKEQFYLSNFMLENANRFIYNSKEVSSIYLSGNIENLDRNILSKSHPILAQPKNSKNEFFTEENPFTSCKIYDEYMLDLNKSCNIYEWSKQSTVNINPNENEDLEKKRICLKQKLSNLWKKVESIFLPKDEVSQALNAAGLWPRPSLITLLPYICKPNQYPKNLIDILGAMAVILTLDQRVERCQILKSTNHSAYLRELENRGYENWSPKEHPEWLLLQLEMNIMIRRRQVEVANHMLETTENMVMQFNMGEGKTSVVIPMLVLALSENKTQLVRLTVLKSLFKINYSSLVYKLGGLLNRRVITIPFNRQIQFGLSDIKELKNTYEQCMAEQGVLLTVPEHRLSFKLKGLESKNNGRKLTLSLIELQDWLNDNVRDILDESDEILHVRYQLVYTIGSQFPIRGDSLRWTIPQEIFRLVKKLIEKFFKMYGPTKIEYIIDNKTPYAFPHIRLLDKEVFFKISEALVANILDGDTLNLGIPILAGEKKEAVMKFIVNEEIDKDELQTIQSMFKDSPVLNELLILRGLFAYGVLFLALNRRWRVNYGVKQDGERLIAVPFRAKDVAAERAEFGHPDVAILLTQLSYYYSGLSTDQLDTVFNKLETLESPEHEYNKWIGEMPEEIVPVTIRNYRAVNLSDFNKKLNVVYPLFECNMAVVDFFLSNVVFPKECKQFKEKLRSFSWDLCEKTKFPVSGFSGTKSCLLPLSIKSKELRQLMGTSGEVLVNLFKEENNDYHVIKNGEGCIEILKRITKCIPSQRVLLDVGALMLELPNHEIAKEWLKLLPSTEVSAAIYFDKDDHLFVQDRLGREVPFELSPYKYDLSKCVTYLDEIHTRGTDLKFTRGMKAAVTLGNGVTFERLAQACLRMRMFGDGHSVSFWASQEVDAFIKEKFNKPKIQTKDIVRWAIYNRIKLERDSSLQWVTQGLSHAKKTFAKQLFEQSTEKSLQLYLSHCKENEVIELNEHYGNPRKLQTLTEICSKQISFIRHCFEYPLPENLVDHIFEECKKSEVKIFSQVLGEEQERELENETEEERVIDRPPPATKAKPHLSDSVIRFVQTGEIDTHSSVFLPLKESFANTSHYNSLKSIKWNSNLYVTRDFITVIEESYNNMDNYLRPPTWMLCSPEYLVFISPYEANGIVSFCKKDYGSSKVKLHMFSPRLRPNQRMFYDEACVTIPSVSNNTPHILDNLFAELTLFSGSLYFNSIEEQQEYCNLLGICPKPRTKQEELIFENGGIDTSGFVLPKHRSAISKTLAKNCIFQQNSMDVARKLIEIRERNSTFTGSHVFDLLMKCKKPLND
ncbi:hypothetical protein ABK040_000515 [Willaertia magna]